MEQLDKILSEILSRYDLSTPEGRDAAYEECVDFAETRLAGDLSCNSFLRQAAQMLEKEPVEFDVIRDMVDIPDGALLDIAYDDRQGFVLTGNMQGLEYFAELLRALVEAPEGEHIHLYNDEEPLTNISFNAILYYEGDEWFQRAEESVAAGSGQEASRRRTVKPEEIFAVQVVGNLPSNLMITRDRIYKVESVSENIPEYDEEIEGEKVWQKVFAGDMDRCVCIEVTDDYDENLEIILHLDDPDVIFFKREDIEHLMG